MKSELEKKYSVSLLFVMVGGYLESYTYITRDGVFANAQTGNIARVGIFLAQGNFLTALRYLVPVLIFVIGASVSIRLKRRLEGPGPHLLSYGQLIVLLEIVLLLAVGLIPPERYSMLATVLVSFTCAIQVESFRHFGENSFSSTMCTGNLRSGTEQLQKYFATGDKLRLNAAIRYFFIDVFFCCFVAVGYWMTARFGTKAVWFCFAPLTVLFSLFTWERCRQRVR